MTTIADFFERRMGAAAAWGADDARTAELDDGRVVWTDGRCALVAPRPAGWSPFGRPLDPKGVAALLRFNGRPSSTVPAQRIQEMAGDPTCDVCADRGAPCEECEGEGKIECGRCEGSGQQTCECIHCSGCEDCDRCGASGSLRCRTCNGGPPAPCGRCGATGEQPVRYLRIREAVVDTRLVALVVSPMTGAISVVGGEDPLGPVAFVAGDVVGLAMPVRPQSFEDDDAIRNAAVLVASSATAEVPA